MSRHSTSGIPPLPNNNQLGVRMHGVSLRLESNHRPLLDYAREHLHGLVEMPSAEPDLIVKCHWSQGDWDPEVNPFSSDGALNVIGKRMLGNANELIWLDTLRMKGLQLRFRREDEQWMFEIAYRFHPKKEKLENLPEYEYKKYFSLMSYLVYYPLIWYLETFRGWTILHASALASEQGGIMIGGLGGVGKTTTCVALMQRPGIALISENIIFTDGEFIYPCDEPIRLDEGSLAMLGDHLNVLTPMAFPEGLKEKWLFHLRTNDLPVKVKPAVLFLPQFSPRRYVTPLAPELAAEKMVAMNRLTRELDDYAWYAAAIEMHWPKTGLANNRIEVLRRFTANARCFELGIDRTAGVTAVVEDILGCL
ncbi:MAG: hypothetical protein ONB44_09825 [candidate division KSB1 bacterium]|nr:hypothetical protein [candidate division KSB1 bacterium]MDZ7302424.1 hypothetical protein [candidate division KSB1 bacterium]MDZ7311626.1 hypothetical protein [candidate division KSB1 bacterium]